MANITPQLIKETMQVNIYKWETVTENDTCLPVSASDKADKTFMATGAFGGGNISLQGTLDPDKVTYLIATDYGGNPITFTTDSWAAVSELALYFRPSTPSGTSVDIDAWLICREGK